MVIRGGFVRDLFNTDKFDKYIDIDIYLPSKYIYEIISRGKYKKVNYIYNIIYLLADTLHQIIFKKRITILKIKKYRVQTSNNYYSSYTFKFNIQYDISLNIDINFNDNHSFCNRLQQYNKNITISNYNIDFYQNSLQLTYNNNFECNSCIKYANTDTKFEKELQKIKNNKLINLLLNNKLIIIDYIYNIICEYIGLEHIFMLKIIYTIINFSMTPCHMICTNNIYCNHEHYINSPCSVEIYKQMVMRYNKFKNKYNITITKCDKLYCVCNGIINNKLIHTDLENFYNEYIKRNNSPYCLYISFPTYLNNNCFDIEISKKILFKYNLSNYIEKSFSKYSYSNTNIIYYNNICYIDDVDLINMEISINIRRNFKSKCLYNSSKKHKKMSANEFFIYKNKKN